MLKSILICTLIYVPHVSQFLRTFPILTLVGWLLPTHQIIQSSKLWHAMSVRSKLVDFFHMLFHKTLAAWTKLLSLQNLYTLGTKEYNFEMVLCQTKLFQTHFILQIPSFIYVKILLVVTCLMYSMFQRVTSYMFVMYNLKKKTAYI